MGLDGPQAGSALGKRNVLGYCPCCSVIPFPHFPLLSAHSSPESALKDLQRLPPLRLCTALPTREYWAPPLYQVPY